MKYFSAIAAPLNEWTKKGFAFNWHEPQESAFQELKENLMEEQLQINLLTKLLPILFSCVLTNSHSFSLPLCSCDFFLVIKEATA